MKQQHTEQKPVNCRTCGGLCVMNLSGLDLVENSGDETLATKNYKSIPTLEETQYEALKESNRVLREALQGIIDQFPLEKAHNALNQTKG